MKYVKIAKNCIVCPKNRIYVELHTYDDFLGEIMSSVEYKALHDNFEFGEEENEEDPLDWLDRLEKICSEFIEEAKEWASSVGFDAGDYMLYIIPDEMSMYDIAPKDF